METLELKSEFQIIYFFKTIDKMNKRLNII